MEGLIDMPGKDFEYNSEKIIKVNKLRERGINPYIDKFDVTHPIKVLKDLKEGDKDIATAGRIVSMRVFGGLIFFHIQDIDDKYQIAITKKNTDIELFEFFKEFIDIGDFIGVKGEIFITQKGEYTLRAYEFKLLTKSLLPLPEKWHGIKDVELRYRKRHLDLIANDETKINFKSERCVKEIRKIFV